MFIEIVDIVGAVDDADAVDGASTSVVESSLPRVDVDARERTERLRVFMLMLRTMYFFT